MDNIGDTAVEPEEEQERRLSCCLRYRVYWVLPLVMTGLTVAALGVVTIVLDADPYVNGPGTGFWIFIAGIGFVAIWLGFLACVSHCLYGNRRRLRANQMRANHQRLEEASEANAAEEVVFDNNNNSSESDDVEDCQPGVTSTSEIELENPHK